MKIGIITHYYNSINYGGNLQAYALCKALEKFGCEAEQIQFPADVYSLIKAPADERTRSQKIMSLIRKAVFSPQRILESAAFLICERLTEQKMQHIREVRSNNFAHFNKVLIPHSEKVYNGENVKECAELYDAFVTGSDQVWNPEWYHPAFYLDFVPASKAKFSYAASLGKTQVPLEQAAVFQKSLADYTGVSVREDGAVAMLDDISPVPVEWVLDPTLLLDREEWDAVCQERLIKEKYVFCYFLGSDKNERKIARKFADKHHLKLVAMPFPTGYYHSHDAHFGDEKWLYTSPEQFISLIKHAEYIFTDSFHGTVFSAIYQKEYFVFHRQYAKGMGARIYSLTRLFESESHFCDTPEKADIDYVENVQPLDYSQEFVIFEAMKEKSMQYLERNIVSGRQMINSENAGEKVE